MNFKKDYAKYYDIFNKEKDYKKETDFLEKVFEKYFKSKNILDLGCGTGIHDRELISRGYNIFGVDISSKMIDIARSKNIKNAKFSIGDMSNFDLDKKFDVCITMFAAIGYLNDNKQIENYIKCVKNHLVKEGLLILDCWNGLGVLRDLPASRLNIFESENIKIERVSYPRLNAIKHVCEVKFKVKIFDRGNLIKEYSEDHSVRFFFPQELKKYLEDAGFEILEICKPFELGTVVDESDWHMSVVAKLKK